MRTEASTTGQHRTRVSCALSFHVLEGVAVEAAIAACRDPEHASRELCVAEETLVQV